MSERNQTGALSAAGALGAAAGALSLFGGVGIWGVTFPLLGLTDSVGRLASALLELASGVQSALPFSYGRLDQMVAFLERLSTGDLAQLIMVAVVLHTVVSGAALALGVVAAWRRSAACALGSAALVICDAGALWAACSALNWQLYLALHSLSEGNPWAVGRGVSGLPAELAPTWGVVAALVLAVAAAAIAIWSLVRRRAGRVER